ncbi:MAG: SDR family oxidoreductase [Pseudomonadota bacterium]
MARLAGKTVLITGAAGAIGREMVALFAAEGARVAASDLSAPDLDGAALALAQDVTREGEWERALAAVAAELGPLDVLVNNAGHLIAKDLEETTLEEWRQMLAVNLDSVFLGTRAAVKAMKGRGGAIVNLSSVAGIVAAPPLAAYGAAKGGVRQFTKAAAIHCAKKGYGIRVNSLHPGFVDSPMVDSIAEALGEPDALKAKLARRQPLGRFANPKEIAQAALYLASDEAAYTTGAELLVDGGFTAE